jgi:outer membrane lipoprotein-sorting protein
VRDQIFRLQVPLSGRAAPWGARTARLAAAPWLLAAGLVTASACAPKAIKIPTGAGTPFPEFASAYQQATASCSGVRTMTATMGMSGKAGRTKLRGRIDAGFAAPGRARLEGIPPFGKPVFVLVAEGGKGTLVLTRDDRVLRDAPPDQIVEALAGVRLDPDALRTAIAGCGFGVTPTEGHRFANHWIAAASADGTTFLRPAPGAGWEVAAAQRGGVTIEYADYEAGRPKTIRLRAGRQGQPAADITLRVSDVAINTPLDARTFDVDLPEHPVPLTLEELRRAGPMGGGQP